mgnify:CR=1 FL=1
MLPHRKPFLFVDEIIETKYMESAIGSRLVKDDEFWAEGHFPGNPVFPGVLTLETMAQVGGFIFANDEGEMPDGNFAFLSKVDGLKFTRKIIPGDRIIVEAKLIEKYAPYYKTKVVARVNNRKMAEAEIVYTFMKKL